MYTPCKLCRKDAVGKAPLNSVGLGASEWDTQSSAGQMVSTTAPLIGMLNPNVMLMKMIPGAEGVLNKVGVNANPFSMGLASFTMGISLLPGVSQLLGKMFGGMFSKATHMGDCMKWWDNENNMRGMASGVVPYPFSFEEYMMKSFPQFLRQYQIMQAGGQWASTGIDSLLNTSNRKKRITDAFVRMVRANPDIMTLHCVVQEKAETGYTGHTKGQVDVFWGQIREAARQEEYYNVIKQVDKVVAKWKVKETWGEIVSSRASGLIVKTEQGAQLRMPENIIGVKRGALVMTLKTPQGQSVKIGK